MKVVQCQLNSHLYGRMVCWLEKRKDLQVGVYVTLKDFDEDPTAKWYVESVGNKEMEKSAMPKLGAFFKSDI